MSPNRILPHGHSNLDSASGILFATVDAAGKLSGGYDKLIKMATRRLSDGRYDVAGL